ncbi:MULTISPECIES: DegT/DnrJ/EryC1/StrS family aminotransferase [Cobetia]|jgi:dTDP-4-amino-4,6-dideoxygalactose transaminase|uniref:DegT/DnrJ/EryC1/StrS family aminotransferase n=1 Tax=Cobetia marina TaxID=28258 RepID=A0ABU9GFJ9_COBMA|nr:MULTISPECIES: DegT/DnrJ/EryC1/StrS family aminotransferase [Cobetia]AOM00948.1 aminotransferase DegT [Cobetia marina]AZV30960.1 DegT/DnrJ/EryC1/StrS family aminotransferase [Cobetia sp. ICG0124]MDA5565014.1 DegT/DnrJ/EryC1/StrS family aminotransferase [Cobetia sp. MMG027]MDH2292429.1 DegT/DnrJ/EryC1/StrS family aminotransferase [Cobetia sp. 10Alg 146]MDH2375345.1 DegT/DnrJ/EryC1/StrS family aminotransferase [Cobetia sp. 3AK]
MITVTRPYFPERKNFDRYVDAIFQSRWLTNHGPLEQELTRRLETYLGVKHLLLVSNGTLALQVAYRALGINNVVGQREPAEVITTPFTFIATASSLKWEGMQPVFADIDPATLCLDPAQVEAAITPRTRAIVPVHVFGNACDVEAIDALGEEHDLKVIYDGAHAFGATYRGNSLLSYGDASTLSFHATKLFHSIEGGAIIFKRKEDLERARKMINFGITGPECIEELGINAKMNEFQAAMGLCVLDEIEGNLESRALVWHAYAQAFQGNVQLQARQPGVSLNYAYFPIILESESVLLEVMQRLEREGYQPRRYFCPSLESLAFLGRPAADLQDADFQQPEIVHSRDIASRILCLPLFSGLQVSEILAAVRVIVDRHQKAA